ncbi:uncharacterized protein LOC134528616 [Bacillus rossius redtenbacheri]|uniref:uncharacterized protein LOC134528616 n=1 Tax=Bacillus rossius redtenbacheri TaxID=93214 RepID=UPI002FDD701F
MKIKMVARTSCSEPARPAVDEMVARVPALLWALAAAASCVSTESSARRTMAEFVTVDISQGRLRGKRVTSDATGSTFYSFRGIPYAKPPLGPLRFKPPRHALAWTGTRDALEEGPSCLQNDMRSGELKGSEDCLYLNVATPQLPETSPKPVMVFIHGGKFKGGSGSMDTFGPDFLVAQDVVYVSVNYRIGAFGFLYLEGADVTGNNGFRDQVMALKWVRDNIAQFGGDPSNVTIFGQSAGAASVHFLMLSPLAKGLFHQAISQSGTVFIGAANLAVDEATRRTRSVAKLLGCSYEDAGDIADFLRRLPSDTFISSRDKSRAGDKLHQELSEAFYPSYETGPAAFLPDTPRNLLESGRFAKVPYIIGITSSEKIGMVLMRMSSPKRSEVDFMSMVPIDLINEITAEKSKEVAEHLKEFYFGDKQLNDDTIMQLVNMDSDMDFVFPMHRVVRQNARWSPQPTYAYMFDHAGPPGPGPMGPPGPGPMGPPGSGPMGPQGFDPMGPPAMLPPDILNKYPGVGHGGELRYLFHSARRPPFPPGSVDAALRDKMVKMWTDFAKTGCPTSDALNVTWLPATQDKERYLRIDGGFTMESDMFKRRMDFWDDLYDQFLPRRDYAKNNLLHRATRPLRRLFRTSFSYCHIMMLEFVTLEVSQGRLRGKRVTSPTSGATYYSFQGIPYAKPPVGPLRFKPPEDPEPWTGTRDALEEGPICVQVDILFSDELVGDEDCLFLNVYTPQFVTTSPKPVMVWIHGGKFSMGSGNCNMFGPDFLVAQNVVVVTINYRLGALGFLYLEGADVTGNNGFRDQVMALKWVRDNIAQFGGDPGNVTIFGESAGGASVHYLTLSPLASGLLHRAIAQSGSVFIGGCNVPVGAANQRARRLARALGCSSEDPRQVAACLRSVPAEQLVADKAKARDNQELHGAILDQFFPSHETGPEAFLPDSPRRLLESGLFSKVPFITGVTSAEGKVYFIDTLLLTRLSDVDRNFTSVLPMELSDNLDVETCNEIAKCVKKFYFGEKPLNKDTVAQFIDMQSDLEFVFPAHEAARRHAQWCQPAATFAYLFDHSSAPGFAFMSTAVDQVPGVVHSGELPYLFHGSIGRSFPPGSPDAEMRSKMVKLWAQFARTGNPSSDVVNVTWTPVTTDKQSYLKINRGFKMETNMYRRRMQFWEDLYRKYLPKKK